jgi:methylated-DNA-[protein]-cysteine S-methyltransferase
MSMTAIGMTMFETALGLCGVAWTPAGICAVQLPQDDGDRARARLQRRTGAQAVLPPPAVADAITRMRALMAGERIGFEGVPLDLGEASSFQRAVWDVTFAIPHGETLTYGEVARRIGKPGAQREVGRALGQNPCPIIVPCHRVLAANGATGGFSGGEGVATKLRMLSAEKARTSPEPLLFDDLPLAARPHGRP